MKKLTREWMCKAESDLAAAQRLADSKPPLHDAVCFHAQQSAEKYLKAVLQEFALIIPKTHDLERLLSLILPVAPQLAGLKRRLAMLSQFAVEYRYPGMLATGRQARSSLQHARVVRAEIRLALGLRPPKSL